MPLTGTKIKTAGDEQKYRRTAGTGAATALLERRTSVLCAASFHFASTICRNANATLSDRCTELAGRPRKCTVHRRLPSARPRSGRCSRIQSRDDHPVVPPARRSCHFANHPLQRLPPAPAEAFEQRRDAVEVGIQSDAQRVSKRPRSFDHATAGNDDHADNRAGREVRQRWRDPAHGRQRRRGERPDGLRQVGAVGT